MSTFPRPPSGSGIPFLLVLEIILFIIQHLGKIQSQDDKEDAIMKRFNISREEARAFLKR